MNIVRNIIKWILIFLVVILVQASIAPKVAIFGIIPDFVMILLFLFSVEYGKTLGIWAGFFVGLFIDVYSSGILGVNAFAKTVVSGAVGFFDKKNFMIGLIFKLIIFAVALIVHDVIIYISNMIKIGEDFTEIYKYIFFSCFPRAIYTTFFAAVFFVAKDLFFPAKWRT